VLIGPMACGKTTVGAIVADAIGRTLIDNDVEVRRATGRTAREIEQDFGTDELHRIEWMELDAALRRTTPAVITAAASVLDDSDGQLAGLLSPHFVVFLRCSGPVRAARAAAAPVAGRPPMKTTAEAVADRERRAERVADLVIDTDPLSPTDIASRISVVDLTALDRRLR